MLFSKRTGGKWCGGCLAGLTLAIVIALPAPVSAGELGEIALDRAGVPTCDPVEARVRPGGSKLIPLDCKGLNGRDARIVKTPRHGDLAELDQRRDSIRFSADGGYRGRDRILVSRRQDGRVWRAAVLIQIARKGAHRAEPECGTPRAIARYRDSTRIRIACRGRGLRPLRVTGGPLSGELDHIVRPVRVDRGAGASRRRVLTATYEPEPRFAGQETIIVAARGRGGTAFGAAVVPVLPWRMRALGDSVTAGFGFYGDPAHNGFEMSAEDLPSCKPPEIVNNRCSSNSDERAGYTGGPEWSADYGLANNVSWAAQFANGIQNGSVTAPDMFQNLAVTGSAPADWLPKGRLNDELESIVAEDPELVVLTLGANPLLTDFLLTVDGEECADSDNVSELEACIQPFIDKNQVAQRLQQVYTDLLSAPDSTIVTFQYYLAIPAANLFEVWQLETIGDRVNEQIETAVENTQKAFPEEADRLILIPAQITPGPAPPGTLPRFNIGLPPDGQGWTPVYDCGDGDIVDGQSHQSLPTQDEFYGEHPFEYCEGDEWIIGADSGIHPNRDGHAQLATTLAEVADAQNLVPRLP